MRAPDRRTGGDRRQEHPTRQLQAVRAVGARKQPQADPCPGQTHDRGEKDEPDVMFRDNAGCDAHGSPQKLVSPGARLGAPQFPPRRAVAAPGLRPSRRGVKEGLRPRLGRFGESRLISPRVGARRSLADVAGGNRRASVGKKRRIAAPRRDGGGGGRGVEIERAGRGSVGRLRRLALLGRRRGGARSGSAGPPRDRRRAGRNRAPRPLRAASWMICVPPLQSVSQMS